MVVSLANEDGLVTERAFEGQTVTVIELAEPMVQPVVKESTQKGRYAGYRMCDIANYLFKYIYIP